MVVILEPSQPSQCKTLLTGNLPSGTPKLSQAKAFSGLCCIWKSFQCNPSFPLSFHRCQTYITIQKLPYPFPISFSFILTGVLPNRSLACLILSVYLLLKIQTDTTGEAIFDPDPTTILLTPQSSVSCVYPFQIPWQWREKGFLCFIQDSSLLLKLLRQQKKDQSAKWERLQ